MPLYIGCREMMLERSAQSPQEAAAFRRRSCCSVESAFRLSNGAVLAGDKIGFMGIALAFGLSLPNKHLRFKI